MEIKRCYDTIIGASVGENQLIQNGDFATSTGWGGRYATVSVSDNVATLTVSSEGRDRGLTYVDSTAPFSLVNHRYLLAIDIKSPITTNASLSFSGGMAYTVSHVTVHADQWEHCEALWSHSGTVYRTNLYALISGQLTSDQVVQYKKAKAIDLTAMFGSTIADYIYTLEQQTAGSGIAWLRSYGFLGGYEAYNAGSIESVEVTEKVVRGFNQVNASTAKDNTYVTGSTGVEVSNDEFACTGYVKCMPSTAYYTNADTNVRIATIVFFDADKNPAGYASASNAVFTTPANAYYIRANVIKARMSVSELVINLSSDRNGEYEPYTERTYDYGDDTLRGIFKLDANNNLYADGDVKTSDGTITRKYGIVDLGTLNYTYFNIEGHYRFVAYPSGIKDFSSNAIANIVCAKYPTDTSNNVYSNVTDKTIGTAGGALLVFDSAYTDATAFKTAMDGVMLVYEKQTPTTEQGDPFASPQVCYPDGTEEYITGNGVPVGHETRYEL